MPVAPRINVLEEPGLRILRFQDRRLWDDSTVREVFEQVSGALPRSSETTVVLDFSQVDAISSSMLGKLVVLQRKVDAFHGQLRLCELNTQVRQVLRSTNLDRLFRIDRDLNESRGHLVKATA